MKSEGGSDEKKGRRKKIIINGKTKVRLNRI
jgi:hypothetical protein